MRYPVGTRSTLGEAVAAAREAAAMVGVEYRVSISIEDAPGPMILGPRKRTVFRFEPRDTPDQTLHMPVNA